MIGTWWKAQRSPRLDLSLSLEAGLTARVVAEPGLILDDRELAEMVEQLRSVARRTLGEGDLTYGVF